MSASDIIFVRERLAEHLARIIAAENNHLSLWKKLDRLENWIMTTLAAVLLCLLAQVLVHR